MSIAKDDINYFKLKSWGGFREICRNRACTVKLLKIHPYSELALCYHSHRSELWKVLHGNPVITIEGKTHLAEKDDEFFIPEYWKHGIKTSSEPVEILEIAYGTFSEDDVIEIRTKADIPARFN